MYNKITARWGLVTVTEEQVTEHDSLTFHGFDSIQDAEEFIATFPKYVRLKRSNLTIYGDPSKGIERQELPIVNFDISNYDKVTGEINETGIKRKATLKRILLDLIN